MAASQSAGNLGEVSLPTVMTGGRSVNSRNDTKTEPTEQFRSTFCLSRSWPQRPAHGAVLLEMLREMAKKLKTPCPCVLRIE